MSQAAAATPYGGGITPGGGGGYNINTPYTPSGQTPILTPYNTPGPSNTPRGFNAPPPMPAHGMPPPPPQRRSHHQPSPGGYGRAEGRSPAGGDNRGRHPPRDEQGGWQSAMDGWARGGRSNRTPRQNDGGNNTPRGMLFFSIWKIFNKVEWGLGMFPFNMCTKMEKIIDFSLLKYLL